MYMFGSSNWPLPQCLCQLISNLVQFHTIFQAMRVSGECLTMGWLSWGKKPRFGALADFHGINTSATADLKLLLSFHWMWIWENCAVPHHNKVCLFVCLFVCFNQRDTRDIKNLKNIDKRDVPGGPVVRTLCFHFREPRFDLCLEN